MAQIADCYHRLTHRRAHGVRMLSDRLSQSAVTSWIAERVPSPVKALIPQALKGRIVPPRPRSASFDYFQDLMRDNYQVRNLVNLDAVAFRKGFESYLALEDSTMEGYASPELQRVKSVRFWWPYDHDFGDFKVGPGKSKYRPSSLLASFMDNFDVLPKRLDGKRVLDIGCFAGGTSLLLAAMGASVVAIEEVKKYVDCLLFLRDAFAIDHLEPRCLSLYELTAEEFQDQFDIVLFAGVLYHLSDPVLGTRITFNVLRPGGTCLLETAVSRSSGRVLEYAGKHQHKRVAGANWFFPSPSVVREMMDEVGYSDISTRVLPRPKGPRDRMLAVGTKVTQVDMLRAGLSVPNIR